MCALRSQVVLEEWQEVFTAMVRAGALTVDRQRG
jgi:hypothetical protein